MKILHLSETYTPFGGVEQYILAAAGLLKEAGHDNVVLYLSDHPGTIRNSEFASYQTPLRGEGRATADELRQAIRREAPHLIFLHTVNSPMAIEAAIDEAPTVAYVHGFLPTCPSRSKFYRRGEEVCDRPFGKGCAAMIYLRRCSEARRPTTVRSLLRATASLQKAYQRIDHFIVASTYMKDLLRQNGFQRQEIHILPPHFQALPEEEGSLDPNRNPTVLFAGRLEVEKGLPYLLQAFVRMHGRARLQVAGDGTRRNEYEKLAHQLGLSERVVFSGWLEGAALHRAYAEANLLALPSIFPEPFAKTGIEALAHGRPVVAFEVGGIPDWLQDGMNGFLIPPGSVDLLASRIDQLLQDYTLANRLGDCGRKMVAEMFNPGHYLARLMMIFHQVVKG